MTARERRIQKNGKRGGRGSRWIAKKRRLAIYLRDNFACLQCQKDLRGADPRDVTLDHFVCHVDGGSNHESNLYTCCGRCNYSRQDKPLSRVAGPEAIEHIKRNMKRDLARYLKLAAAILTGELGDPRIEKG
jgi:5-methylcytosine-specific restriction endonuclease McrA